MREIQAVSKPRQLLVRMRQALRLTGVPPVIRRVIVGVIGGTVVLIGVALVVLPGPALVVIPLGLAILATEFMWARRLLRKARALVGIRDRRTEGTANTSSKMAASPSPLRARSG